MTEAIEKLKLSLIYQMSLGGRELYHSNVWCWLMKQDSAFIRVFFPSFDPEKDKVESIQREWLNMDLVIKLANQKIYIIENKLKSLPYPEQLQKYTEKQKQKATEFSERCIPVCAIRSRKRNERTGILSAIRILRKGLRSNWNAVPFQMSKKRRYGSIATTSIA